MPDHTPMVYKHGRVRTVRELLKSALSDLSQSQVATLKQICKEIGNEEHAPQEDDT